MCIRDRSESWARQFDAQSRWSFRRGRRDTGGGIEAVGPVLYWSFFISNQLNTVPRAKRPDGRLNLTLIIDHSIRSLRSRYRIGPIRPSRLKARSVVRKEHCRRSVTTRGFLRLREHQLRSPQLLRHLAPDGQDESD